MSSEIRIAVHGAGGRMGQAVLAAVQGAEGLVVSAATEAPQSSLLGVDAGEVAGLGTLGVAISADLSAALNGCDAVIDFTRPEGTMALLEALESQPRALITGTTGLDAEQAARLDGYAARAPLVQAANFSVGVNLCVKLTELAARVLDEAADVEIIEAHHRHKVDAPSGTALRLGEAAASATGRSLDNDAVYSREGHTGPRPERGIGFATVRAGDIVGEHTVLFACEGERVEISHKATSRQNFATGAVRAARWACARAPGRYDMNDVLELDARLD